MIEAGISRLFVCVGSDVFVLLMDSLYFVYARLRELVAGIRKIKGILFYSAGLDPAETIAQNKSKSGFSKEVLCEDSFVSRGAP